MINNNDSKPSGPRKSTTVVYACSGCSDAGEIADRVARQLSLEGAAQMSCLAGIGGRVKSLMATAERAERILVVDGCPLNCARKTLELAGFNHFDHLELQTLGIRKGSAPVTSQRIAAGVEAARRILAIQTAPGSSERIDSCHSPVPKAVGSDTARSNHENETVQTRVNPAMY